MSKPVNRQKQSLKPRVSVNGAANIAQRFSTVNPDGSITIKIPSYFGIFDNQTVVFERCLKIFDWSIRDKFVYIDFSECRVAGHQAINLLLLYLMHLKSQGCCGEVLFTHERGDFSHVPKLWKNVDAASWPTILSDPSAYFVTREDHPLYAVRDYDDFNVILEKFGAHIHNYDIAYSKTLRHIMSELIYNAIEHGGNTIESEGKRIRVPALISYYHARKTNELNILIADTGMGIKDHLKSFIPDLEDDISALMYSIKPKISGTFGVNAPYSPRNNAGMGLFISSGLIRNIRADMYIISGKGAIHISPSDTTSRTMGVIWPGTAVFLNIKLGSGGTINSQEMMDKIYQSARDEIQSEANRKDEKHKYFNMYNYFGKYAENKGEAINFRDNHLLPTLRSGKNVKLDFDEIESSPHSFLNALFASVVKEFGEKTYRIVRIINAQSSIKDVIEYIIEDNLEHVDPEAG